MPDLMTDWGDVESKLRARGGALYDPSDLEGIKRNTGYAEGGTDLESALNNAYANYDVRRGPTNDRAYDSQSAAGNALYGSGTGNGSNVPGGPTGYSSGTGTPGAAGSGDAALASFQDYLKSRDAAATSQRDAFMQILRGQLGDAASPLSADAPGIREVLGGQRLALQRGAERQRAGAAEQRAYDGSGGLGGKAFASDVKRIEQQRAESDATMTGGVLNQELNAKRDNLTRLLAMATQLGDAESARTLQAQLQAIQTQLGQSNFYDTSAFNYAGLNQQGNLATLMAILNAA